MDLTLKKWKKIDYDERKFGRINKNFSMPYGVRMLQYKDDETNHKVFYLFSGQTSKSTLASNIRIC